MGAGRPQRQRRLRRDARPARRLPVAAVRSASRQAPDAAVPHCAGAARHRCGPSRPARHRLPKPGRWHHGADRIAGRRSPRMQRQIAGRRGRFAFGCSRTDVSRPAADPVGRRDHVARYDARRAHPHRCFVRRGGLLAASSGAVSDLSARSEQRPGDDQLDRRDHGRQRQGLGPRGLESPCVARRLHAPLCRLELRLARRAGDAAAAPTRSSSTR